MYNEVKKKGKDVESMDKDWLMRKIAIIIEWYWLRIRCQKEIIHILWRRRLVRKTTLLRTLSRRMAINRERAKELQNIYNVLYFNEY